MAARRNTSGTKRKSGVVKSGDFNRLDGFLLNAVPDETDFRDYAYRPALLQLKPEMPAPVDRVILDQGSEGACTGFGLAAVINQQLQHQRNAQPQGQGDSRRVSPRMLYEMAKKFDEWEGEDYSGSSCRGAVQGWYSMGVCSEQLAPYSDTETGWALNIEQAVDARKTTLGAYYRVNKQLPDYHAALNEVGALYCSANVHEGWQGSKIVDDEIPFEPHSIGGHAFAIIGYNNRGFWVQNSWGPGWGNNGVALWLYEDWLENVRDAWILRLALSTPQVWHLTPNSSGSEDTSKGLFKRSPKRAEILGHFVHLDDGNFDDSGKCWMNLATIRQTAEHVANSSDYDHLLLYAHGGLNSIKASARRIVAMKEVFKANRIYPFHFMYDTGLMEEIKDMVLGKKQAIESRAGGMLDVTDRLIEKATRLPGRAIWREMKSGARKPFDTDRAGAQTIAAFLSEFARPGVHGKKIHMVGHSTGAILLAALLRHLQGVTEVPRIQNCLLLAPACNHDEFKETFLPLVRQRDGDQFGIGRMGIYILEDDLELEDTVTPLYRKSLLYLVSNAFEEKIGERILGMQKFNRYLRNLPGRPVFRIEESDGSKKGSPKTASEVHGGFDNDLFTMNDVLHSILGQAPARKFTESDLDY